MIKIFFTIIFVISFIFNAYAELEWTKYDKFNKFYTSYMDCKYYEIKRKHKIAFIYNTAEYLIKEGEKIRELYYNCNKKLELIINSTEPNFSNLLIEDIENNSPQKAFYLESFMFFHLDTINYSNNNSEIKKSFNELENILKKLNVEENYLAARISNSLGWLFYTKINFIDNSKAFKYLNMSIKNSENDYYLGYCVNNLGVLYDQGRGVKRDYKKAFKLYQKAAKLGNHYGHANSAKFYILGLGGLKKDYSKAIKHYKLARVTDHADNQFIDLALLYKKKRLPKNISEYLSWFENYIIETQDGHGFQQLAWLSDDFVKETVDQKMNAYKWHYLAFNYSPNFNERERAASEMHVLETQIISVEQVEKAKKEAREWINKFWKI
jgi:TPR repeat protein